MNVKELKARAKELGLRGYSKLRKAELISLVDGIAKIEDAVAEAAAGHLEPEKDIARAEKIAASDRPSTFFVRNMSLCCEDCGCDDITVNGVIRDCWCTECGSGKISKKSSFRCTVEVALEAVNAAIFEEVIGSYHAAIRACHMVVDHRVRRSLSTRAA